jgi:hypothetical protein
MTFMGIIRFLAVLAFITLFVLTLAMVWIDKEAGKFSHQEIYFVLGLSLCWLFDKARGT